MRQIPKLTETAKHYHKYWQDFMNIKNLRQLAKIIGIQQYDDKT